VKKAEPVAAKPEPAKTEVAKAEPVKVKPSVATTVAATTVVTQPEKKAEPVKAEAVKPTVAKAEVNKNQASSTTAAGSTPDWRSYGPLQVDWANWQAMGGSYVAPSLNSEGQPLYLAINCNAKRLNATGQSGAWKTWDAPQSDFEQRLITDLCKAKPG
jgi:outer membrane biosynthesis protein TonB